MQSSSNFRSANYHESYGIWCSPQSSGKSRSGLYPTFCRIDSKGRSAPHQHFEPEVFYIVHGIGEMSIDVDVFPVESGDLIRVPPFSTHSLKNSGYETLEFLSVYGEDFEVDHLPRSAVITAAPPTPNGSLHLGHISGPYLAADVLSRYLKLRGGDVSTRCGTDDHQNYVAIAAKKSGLELNLYREAMRRRIQSSLSSTSIGFDEFIAPAKDSEYQRRVQDFFCRCIDTGTIKSETLALPYCVPCSSYLRDVLLSGNCPGCGEASSGGCEACGIVVMPQEVLCPKCSQCDAPAISRLAQVYTFDVAAHLAPIAGELRRLNLPARITGLVDEVASKISHKLIVSYPAQGVSSEEILFAGQNIHVWFEMAAAYETYASMSQTWIHCFGFDNSFYYLLLIPTVHRALSPTAKLPDHVITNEFLYLEGKKFSTSRGHAIWADDFQGKSDHLRLFLGRHRPQAKVDNFNGAEFEFFSKSLEEKTSALLDLIRRPGRIGSKHRVHRTVVTANRYTRDFELFYSPENFDLRRAAQRLEEFIDTVLNDDTAVTGGSPLLVRALATCMLPLMPELAEQILTHFKMDNVAWVTDWANKL